MNFNNFCTIVINQWRLGLESQIFELKSVFYDHDEDGDGLLNLTEFSNMMENLEAIQEQALKMENVKEKIVQKMLGQLNRMR